MAWTPLSIPGVTLYIDAAYSAHQWKESQASYAGVTNANTLTDPVGAIEDAAGAHSIWAGGDLNRFTWNGSGGKSWWTGGGIKHVQVQNSQGLRFLTYQPSWWFKARVLLTTASNGANQVLFDSANSTNTAVGMMICANSTGNPALLIGNGAASILTAAPSSGTAMSNNTWHDIIVQVNYNGGAGTASIQLDTNTAATSTFVSAGTNSNMTNPIEIGCRASGFANPWAGNIAHIVMGYGTLSGSDLTNLRAWNPDTTSTSLAVATSSANSILSTDVPFLFLDYDFTTKTNLWKASDKAVQVTADGDTVGYVINSKTIASGSSYTRDATQATGAARPLYKDNQFGSVGAVYFNGAATDADAANFTNEVSLLMQSPTPFGACSMIAFYQNLRAGSGSHIMSNPTTRYIVQTGSTYQSGTYGWAVLHTTGTAYDSPRPTSSEAANGWWMRHSGVNGTQYVNTVAGTASTSDGAALFNYIGRPAHKSGGFQWDMNGPIARIIVYAADIPADTLQRVANTVATQLGVTAAYSSGTIGKTRMNLGLGLGI